MTSQGGHTKYLYGLFSVSVQFSVRLFATPWTVAHQASLSITSSQSLLKLMSIESVMPSNRLILCHPLLPPSIFPNIRVFSNESALCIRCPKYWSFSFNISPLNEYSGLISFRMDWLDLRAVQGTLKSLLQHHSSKASIHKETQTLSDTMGQLDLLDIGHFTPKQWISPFSQVHTEPSQARSHPGP